ncbi:MAG: DNA polymerase III subunit gamma/tau [Nitrospirae bacterium]|jgi:DNA polymerase III, subunit gamma and tau|nr:DNA polymerase III subunit gamma/tau [Nitrospirota bacterium]
MAKFASLARLYRPRTFSDLIGQEAVVRSLTRGLSSGVMTQAYLFSGERGVGKTTVARILAKAINCQSGPTATPCLECSSCLEIAEGRSPDVTEMDGASHTGVDDVRTLRESLVYAPLTSRSRIVIIDEVHMLSTSAFNALLKTLEEPPPHVVFILATTEAHKIPDTVLSRCQHFRFRLLTVSQISDRILHVCRSENISLNPTVTGMVARAAEGSLRDALSLLDQLLRTGGESLTPADVADLLGVTDHALEEKMLAAILLGDLSATLRTARTALDTGVDPRAQVRSLARRFRDILHSTLDGTSLDSPIYGWIPESVQALPLDPPPNIFFLEQALSVLVKGEDDLRRSPQPAITFELLLARLCHLREVLPLPEILAKIGVAGATSPSSVRSLGPKTHNSSLPTPLPTTEVPTEVFPSPPEESSLQQAMPQEIPAPVDDGPLDLRIPADWPRALSRLPHEMAALLESVRTRRIEQNTLYLDTGNSFFNTRIQASRDPLAKALSLAIKSPEPLRIETPTLSRKGNSTGQISSEIASSGDKRERRNLPPLVSDAVSLFGSEVLDVRSPQIDRPLSPSEENE